MKRIILVSLAVFALAACNRGRNGNPIQNARVAAQDRDLQHSFTSSCSLKPVEGIAGELATGFSGSFKSSRVVYKFTGANLDRNTYFYGSTKCEDPVAVTFNEVADFTLGQVQPQGSSWPGNVLGNIQWEGKTIDFDFHTLSVNVAQSGVQVANSTKLCGQNDWQAGKDRDETANAQKCLGVALPRHNSNAYRIDNSVLYLGQDTTANIQPNERPQSLSVELHQM